MTTFAEREERRQRSAQRDLEDQVAEDFDEAFARRTLAAEGHVRLARSAPWERFKGWRNWRRLRLEAEVSSCPG